MLVAFDGVINFTQIFYKTIGWQHFNKFVAIVCKDIAGIMTALDSLTEIIYGHGITNDIKYKIKPHDKDFS